MELRIFNVEHGAAALLWSRETKRIALIDCGHNGSTGWNPSHFLEAHGVKSLDYLIVSNADQDHYSHLHDLLQKMRPRTFIRNRKVSPDFFRNAKLQNGKLSKDAEAYLHLEQTYTTPTSETFNDLMGGVTLTTFCHSTSDFLDLNNLSLVCFFEYNGFTILFPGDLEPDGWNKFLANAQFLNALARTNVLMAPHHGRIHEGYSEILSNHLQPSAVIISDKKIEHGTQIKSSGMYGALVQEPGILIANTGNRRSVLTTRYDGNIHISINDNGSFVVTTGVSGG